MSLDFSPTPADCGLASPSHFTLDSHRSVRVSCLVLASHYFRLPHLSHTLLLLALSNLQSNGTVPLPIGKWHPQNDSIKLIWQSLRFIYKKSSCEASCSGAQ